MKETLYMNEQMAILNFSASYARTPAELLNSPTFKNLVESFIDDLETSLYRLRLPEYAPD